MMMMTMNDTGSDGAAAEARDDRASTQMSLSL